MQFLELNFTVSAKKCVNWYRRPIVDCEIEINRAKIIVFHKDTDDNILIQKFFDVPYAKLLPIDEMEDLWGEMIDSLDHLQSSAINVVHIK